VTPGGAADPHHDVPVGAAGAPLGRAKAAVVMLHGRGADAGDMLSLAEVFAQPDLAYLAPQAAGRSWYPTSFLAPIARNEPFLSSALDMLDRVLGGLGAESYQPGRIVLLGFSQGACLALEYAARRARRYGGLIGLSGGLIGPEGTPRDYPGDFAETPVFLGCSDVDPHIPVERVHETGRVLGALGGAVTKRIYPGMGHAINDDEIRQIRSLLARFANGNEPAGPDRSAPPRETEPHGLDRTATSRHPAIGAKGGGSLPSTP
jgi:predicted esterase